MTKRLLLLCSGLHTVYHVVRQGTNVQRCAVCGCWQLGRMETVPDYPLPVNVGHCVCCGVSSWTTSSGR